MAEAMALPRASIATMQASVGLAEAGLAVVVPQLLRGGPPPTLLGQGVQEGIYIRAVHLLGCYESASLRVDLKKIWTYETRPDLRALVQNEITMLFPH